MALIASSFESGMRTGPAIRMRPIGRRIQGIQGKPHPEGINNIHYYDLLFIPSASAKNPQRFLNHDSIGVAYHLAFQVETGRSLRVHHD